MGFGFSSDMLCWATFSSPHKACVPRVCLLLLGCFGTKCAVLMQRPTCCSGWQALAGRAGGLWPPSLPSACKILHACAAKRRSVASRLLHSRGRAGCRCKGAFMLQGDLRCYPLRSFANAEQLVAATELPPFHGVFLRHCSCCACDVMRCDAMRNDVKQCEVTSTPCSWLGCLRAWRPAWALRGVPSDAHARQRPPPRPTTAFQSFHCQMNVSHIAFFAQFGASV